VSFAWPKPVAVVLAAGFSRRFGSNKLMHPLSDGRSILWHSLQPYINAGCDLACVTRPDSAEVISLLKSLGIKTLSCDQAEQGMSASIAVAAQYAHSLSRPLMLGLGDMPYMRAQSLQQLLQAWDLLKPEILYPCVNGQQGHPVVFRASYFSELASLEGDKGAKSLLAGELATAVNLEDIGLVRDIDISADLSEC